MRYSLQPLADAMGESMASLGRLLGVSGSTWQEYRDQGVTERVADRLAVKAGLPTLAVWPEMTAEAEQVCEANDCEIRFIAPRLGQRFCSPRCRHRVRMRRYRAKPEVAAAAREASRRFYWDTAVYQRKRAQRYRDAQKLAA